MLAYFSCFRKYCLIFKVYDYYADRNVIMIISHHYHHHYIALN